MIDVWLPWNIMILLLQNRYNFWFFDNFLCEKFGMWWCFFYHLMWSFNALFYWAMSDRLGIKLADKLTKISQKHKWPVILPEICVYLLGKLGRNNKWHLPLWLLTHTHKCVVDVKSYQMSAFLKAERKGRALLYFDKFRRIFLNCLEHYFLLLE